MPKPKRDDEGISRRVCRACAKSYSYPDVGSAATRFHCDHCALLPKHVQKTFEQLTRRINQLERQLAKAQAAAK